MYDDIKRVSKWLNIDEELLFVIYTQRVTRDATKRYHIIKNYIQRLQMEWKNGKSLVKIAKEWRYPPVLMSFLIMTENYVNRKQFWKWVNDPESIEENRLKSELKEAINNDLIYSPYGMELQTKRGKMGEAMLFKWLDSHNIKYETEYDIKHKLQKTPDVLFKKVEHINGLNVRWIESKANFGDYVELKRNYKKQLKPYREMFGEGIVVYWLGYIDDINLDKEGIYVKNKNFFNNLGTAIK